MTDEPFDEQHNDDSLLAVAPGVTIPRAELRFRTSRSSGPGGQHVNKTESRVELLFDLANSSAFTEEQRLRLQSELKPWLDSDGEVHIISEQHRSQWRNREETVTRFIQLIQQALRPRKTRRPTRIPRAVHEARLEHKKQRSQTKRLRGRRRGDDD